MEIGKSNEKRKQPSACLVSQSMTALWRSFPARIATGMLLSVDVLKRKKEVYESSPITRSSIYKFLYLQDSISRSCIYKILLQYPLSARS